MRDFTAGHITSEDGRALIEAMQQALRRPGRRDRPRLDGRARVPPRRQLPQHPRLPRQRTAAVHRRDARPSRRTTSPTSRSPTTCRRGPGADLLQRPDGAQPGRLRATTRSTRPAARRASGRRRRSGSGARARRRACGRSPRSTASSGAILSAVDLVRGVGVLLGWKRIDVPGATGYLDTDYAAKGRLRRRGPGRSRPGLRPRRGPRRGVARGQGRRQGQGAGRDRRAHRRPAAGGAAGARRLAHPRLAGPPHAAADPGPRLRRGAVRAWRAPAIARQGQRPTTRWWPQPATLAFDPGHLLMRRFLA